MSTCHPERALVFILALARHALWRESRDLGKHPANPAVGPGIEKLAKKCSSPTRKIAPPWQFYLVASLRYLNTRCSMGCAPPIVSEKHFFTNSTDVIARSETTKQSLGRRDLSSQSSRRIYQMPFIPAVHI